MPEITVKKSFHRDPEARLIWLLPDELSDCVSGRWNNVFPLFMAREHESKASALNGEEHIVGLENWDISKQEASSCACPNITSSSSSSSSRRRLRCDNVHPALRASRKESTDATSAVVFLNHSRNREHENCLAIELCLIMLNYVDVE